MASCDAYSNRGHDTSQSDVGTLALHGVTALGASAGETATATSAAVTSELASTAGPISTATSTSGSTVAGPDFSHPATIRMAANMNFRILHLPLNWLDLRALQAPTGKHLVNIIWLAHSNVQCVVGILLTPRCANETGRSARFVEHWDVSHVAWTSKDLGCGAMKERDHQVHPNPLMF